jgi:hypothetical protein
MIIELQRLPESLLGPATPDYQGKVPSRFRLLQPDAAESLLKLEADSGGLVYTDIYRSPESQLAAHRAKGGTQPVGFSGHGYGIAVDLEVTSTLRRMKASYPQLCDVMMDHGWYCHRRDLDPVASESWHFNFLGPDADRLIRLADPQQHASWARPCEARIVERYGKDFEMDAAAVQAALAALGFSKVVDFQRAWDLRTDGIAGPTTRRVLAYVGAEVRVDELPNV